MSVPVGISVPKLLPIAGTWVAPFALYNILLSSRVFSERVRTEVYFGDKDTSTTTSSSASGSKYSALELASRAHGNFLENVPLAFVFLIVAELNGGNRKALNYAMGTFLALRVAHAHAGLLVQGKFGDGGVGRPVGYVGSLGVLGGLAGYAGYLVKGYWGL